MLNKRSRIDPRVVRTRQLLRSALTSLISEKGYASISIQEITDRASLNRATFYLHYRDKNSLLIDVLEELLNEAAPLPPSGGAPAADTAQESVVLVFDHFAEHAKFYYRMLAEENVPEFSTRVRSYVEEVGLKWLIAIQPDEDKVTVPRGITINFIGSAFIGVLVWWLQNEMPYSSQEMAAYVLLLTGFGLNRVMGMDLTE